MEEKQVRHLLDSLGLNHASLMVLGYKYFGNPIPSEWYAAAEELLLLVKTPTKE